MRISLLKTPANDNALYLKPICTVKTLQKDDPILGKDLCMSKNDGMLR